MMSKLSPSITDYHSGIGECTMRRLPAVLPLLAAWSGAAPLGGQTPDSIRTFSSTHLDSTRYYYTQVVLQPRVDTVWCTDVGCGPTPPKIDPPPQPRFGVPFGPVSLYRGATPRETAVPFTGSQDDTSPKDVVTLIANARAAKQSVILAMTGGGKAGYSTDGVFDLAKWERRIDEFNTPAIRDAIAEGVADGTVIANALIDEPEHKKWGPSMSKALVDSMAAYAKRYFPTLPMGPSHGQDGYYRWHPDERYRVVDYVRNQYNWRIEKGNIGAWRDKVLAQARRDGVAVAWSLNILDGGEQAPKDGSWTCPATSGGRGTYEPNCRMTAAQIRDWGKLLGPSGCALVMWRYDQTAMDRPDNQKAMADVAAALAQAPRRPCTRPAA
jgi:hypothetical protein